jgi:signal transduction histidine kinase
MIKWYNSSVVKGVFAMAMIILSLVNLFWIIFSYEELNRASKRAYDYNQKVLENLKKDINQDIASSKNIMKILSNDSNLKESQYEVFDLLAQSAVENDILIEQIYYMKADGMQVYKTSHLETLGDRSDRIYFQEAIEGELYFSDGIKSRSTKDSITVLAVPVMKNDEIVGVLGASLDLSSIYKKIELVKIKENGYAYMVDRDGVLIAHPRQELVEEFTNVSYLEPVSEMLDGNSGWGEYEFEGVVKIVAYEIFEETSWGIAVQVPKSEALEEVNLIKQQIVVYTVLGFIVVWIVLIIFVKYYERPFMDFLSKIRDLKSSGYEKPFDEIRKDEIGLIQSAINTMADETRQSKENLEYKVENRTRKLKSSLDLLTEKELDLERKNKELEDALIRLENTQAQLVENKKIQSLNHMTSSLSHEINTPLGIILTNSSYINVESEKVNQKLEEKTMTKTAMVNYLRDMLHIAEVQRKQGDKIKGLVEALKELSSTGVNLQKENVNIGECIERNVQIYVLEKQRTDIKVHLELEDDIWRKTYPTMLGKIITHLLQNSYTHAKIKGRILNITIRMKNENNKIILDYMDDGIGISKEKAKHSVEPFFKGKMSARGAGIGLSLIHNLIHVLFDGEMSVESDSGKGFRVTMII